MDNSDESILNNHHTDAPTLELIDIESVPSDTLDYYPKSNKRKDVSYLWIEKKKIYWMTLDELIDV